MVVGKTGRVEEEEVEVEGRFGEKENTVKKVTRELKIKGRSNGGENIEMDKDVVLRRIRQRKRVNKFRSALQALVTSPFSKNTIQPSSSSSSSSWLDDPFAAL